MVADAASSGAATLTVCRPPTTKQLRLIYGSSCKTCFLHELAYFFEILIQRLLLP